MKYRFPAIFIGFFLVTVIFAWELLMPGRSLYRWDTLLYQWPILLEAREQILSGNMPFWSSSFCCGTPLLASINPGLLYPLRILSWLLPLKAGYHLFLFAHLWLSLVGMYIFVRRGMRRSVMAAFAGALVYGCSGYMRGMWDTHNFWVMPWIPLAFVALLEARNASRWIWSLVGTAVSWSMMILCGDPQSAFFWLPVALLMIILDRRSERIRLVAVLAGAILLSVLITAPQWIPSIFAFTESYRAGGLAFTEATECSFNPIRVLELFLPHVFGSHGQWFGTALAGSGATKTTPWVSSFHVGLLPLLAAGLAMRKRQRPMVIWSLFIFLVPLFLSFGRFLPGFKLWQHVPIFSGFRYPEKYLLWSTLGMAVLAAHGIDACQGLWHKTTPLRSRRRLLGWWALTVLSFGIIGVIISYGISIQDISVVQWLAGRFYASCFFVLLVLLAGTFTRLMRYSWVLAALLMLDLLLPWNAEQPTTNRFDPLSPPAVASVIQNSSSPRGRFLRDPATMNIIPLPAYFSKLNQSEQMAVFHRERLAFNSPRIWGMSTASGFSPLESGITHRTRLQLLALEKKSAPSPSDLANFCRLTGVEWLVTTEDRARALLKEGIEAETISTWNGTPALLLLRLKHIAQAEFAETSRKPTSSSPVVRDVWRQGHGKIRIDLSCSTDANLTVKETYARGWQARDEIGNSLSVKATPAGFINVAVPAGTSEVRLLYEPPGWRMAVFLGMLGLLIVYALFLVGIGDKGLKRWAKSPAAPVIAGCILFFVVGFFARTHWACTFDEGFHITRGLARLNTGDSRLSYYHPPLQNIACAYFAKLAHGEYMRIPDTPGWQKADIFLYATELATANRDIFPAIIRASRWGSSIFGLLLCVIGIIWAFRAAGPLAGWLAAFGLSLNPNLLAHGNLTTTDMSVTALAVAGSFGLWSFINISRPRILLWTSVCFALAAVAKHTGLIWLGIYVLVCVPLLAIHRRNLKLLWHAPISTVCLFIFLTLLYGLAPQTVRVEQGSWWYGKPALVAGRYVEGLLAQTEHVLEGHRSFFAGQHFIRGLWWHMPLVIVLKTPLFWLSLMLAAVFYFFRKRRSWSRWIPWLPSMGFSILLCAANRMSTGMRHTLPVVALAIIGAAIWVARLSYPKLRNTVAALLVSSSLITALFTFPHFISYFPRPFGGVNAGYRWLVDSNYDWGQDIEVLENTWAQLTRANQGRPPRLLYLGFVDPRVIYRMPVKSPSLCGFMGKTLELRRGEQSYSEWLEGLANFEGTTVPSISAIELNPYGVDLSGVRNGKFLGRLGNTFFIYYGKK